MNAHAPTLALESRAGGQSAPSSRCRRLFVVTYGRSGSTLLQGVLNALPGYLIRGENEDILSKLQAFWDVLAGTPDPRSTNMASRAEPSTPAEPFFGYERHVGPTFAAALARFLDTLLADEDERARNHCLGFKEIRYTPEDVAEKVALLRRLYPGCGIIYNIRAPEDVANSEFQRDKPARYFKRFNDLLESRAQADAQSVLVRYEDVVAGSGTLLDLFRFLDEPFEESRHRRVLATKHSYHTNKTGSIYSNIPADVQVARPLPNMTLFVVDKLFATAGGTQLTGFMLEASGVSGRRFARLLDSAGQVVPFSAQYGTASPALGRKMGTQAAANARFRITFKTHDPAGMRVYFGNDELAMTIMPGAHPATKQQDTSG